MCSRIRPINIIYYRNNEALCILPTDDFETAEWIDVENIDIENNHDMNLSEEQSELPMPGVEKLHDWLQSP